MVAKYARKKKRNQSKVVSYAAGLAGHWRLPYDSAKELMQPLAPAATFAGCLPAQVGWVGFNKTERNRLLESWCREHETVFSLIWRRGSQQNQAEVRIA